MTIHERRKKRRRMYRTERLDGKLIFQASRAMKGALQAEADQASTCLSVFARRVILDGLDAWRARQRPRPRTAGRQRYRPVRLDMKMIFNVSPAMRNELMAEAGRAMMGLSGFLRLLITEGLKACRARQQLRLRAPGGS